MPTTTVMTRSTTAQMRAAAALASSSHEEEAQQSSAQPPATPPSLRVPLGSCCNGVSSNNHHHQQNGAHKRHQSLSPAPNGHENGSRAVTPPHTPPKLVHHNSAQTVSPQRELVQHNSTQNVHVSPHRELVQHNSTQHVSPHRELVHHNSTQNGHVSPRRSRESSPQHQARCSAPKSPPTPHRIKLVEEKENEKKPKKNLLKSGSLNLAPVVQQNGHKPEPVAPSPDSPKLQPKPEKPKLPNPNPQHQTKLTKFFPIRRSERRPKTEVEAKQQKTIEDRLAANNDSELGLKIQYFPEKGRGVASIRRICKGDFVVEYSGDLIDVKMAKERETKYAMDLSKGCYMYYFRANNRQYCIDATSETGRLGRLVNHSRLTPNLSTKVIVFRGTPRLILVARRDIEPGDELLYDYGDRSKESLEAHPWLAL